MHPATPRGAVRRTTLYAYRKPFINAWVQHNAGAPSHNTSIPLKTEGDDFMCTENEMPTDQTLVTSARDYIQWIRHEAQEVYSSAPGRWQPPTERQISDCFGEMLDIVGLLVHFMDMKSLSTQTRRQLRVALADALISRIRNKRKSGGRAGRVVAQLIDSIADELTSSGLDSIGG